jgi:hypothetical protein
MTVRVREISGSESGTDSLDTAEATIEMVTRSDTRSQQRSLTTCRTAVLNYLAATYPSGYVVDTGYPLTLDKLSRDYDDEADLWMWKADYNYKPPESALRWGFDTTGGSIRVRHSRGTTRYPGSAPDHKGAIQVENGEPQGADLVIPALKLSATYRWPKNTIDTTYVNAVASMSGTTNSSSFYTYAAGELLFLGASGEIVPNIPTEITYQFAASANATGLSVGGIITGIAKQGHQLLWVQFEDDEDLTAKRIIKKPLGAYVETLYPSTSFSALGI